MGSVNLSVNSVVNAAASAIVNAEPRLDEPDTEPKKRWGSCWRFYWCFGSHKSSKRIGHAVLVPEPVEPTGPAANTGSNPSTAIVLPFVAPPSSPASFVPSDPPSATQSPSGLLSPSSLAVDDYSSGGPASIFAIGPYAYETQLVTPPTFSNVTSEPSTASFTPPAESVQLTSPSSPEGPFAEFLTFNYDFQHYQQYPGNAGCLLISPGGSVISASSGCTPFPDRHPILEFSKGEAPKHLGIDHFSTPKGSSRLGSGSLTPDSAGQGSRLGSGSQTPDAVGLASQLVSGCLTPDGERPAATDGIYVGKRISEVASRANSENGCQTNATLVDRRVSFEFTVEDVARCLANKPWPLFQNMPESSEVTQVEDRVDNERIQKDSNSCGDLCSMKTSNDKPDNAPGEGEGEEQCYQKHQSSNSSKEFNFDNTKGDVSNNPANGSQLGTNKKVVEKEGSTSNSWAFFPTLQPENS
ncbi:uncharacterized protein LOC133307919 [Gastrolobium bilobum]|uniref:uncharacterized protein LOC133307919 n=1 Tax=Gastrolobium bilobum TaxID=150636 RepID=UPI002AAF350D|nr:uncharacterized protein LOC133307919 [Gastrolobium bilobum]